MRRNDNSIRTQQLLALAPFREGDIKSLLQLVRSVISEGMCHLVNNYARATDWDMLWPTGYDKEPETSERNAIVSHILLVWVCVFVYVCVCVHAPV